MAIAVKLFADGGQAKGGVGRAKGFVFEVGQPVTAMQENAPILNDDDAGAWRIGPVEPLKEAIDSGRAQAGGCG